MKYIPFKDNIMKFTTLYILLFLLCSCFEVQGQTKTTLITGVVKTESGEFVPHSTIFFSKVKQKNRILASGQSNSKGEFQIALSVPDDSIALHVTHINIEPVTISCKNTSQKIDVIVQERVNQLEDIVVKSPKIYANGDTINYRVAAFQHANDLSIGQVLQRLPGITVSNIGQISYKGMPIKNFYIEGLDLMKGRYGIATNNIDPNSISTVQVLENHQDIKALKDLKPEERASINLKLKSGVKGIFNLIATLGAGLDKKALWNNELIATYFKRNSQLLATYKGNNTGNDLGMELRSFDEGGTKYKTATLTEMTMPGTPVIGKRYYYFNLSHTATFNQVIRIGSNGELGLNVAFLKDKDKRNLQSTSTAYLPTGERNIVNESINGLLNKRIGYGTATYMLNNSNYYIKEQLKTELISTHGYSNAIIGNQVNQQSKMNNCLLQNTLHFTYRTSNNHGIDFLSKVNYEKRPHQLSVSSNLFPEILSDDNMFQHVNRSNISTENKIDLLSALVLGRLTVHPFTLFNFSADKLNSSLQQYQNDISLNTTNIGIGFTANYKLGKTYFNFLLSGVYRLYSLRDHLVGLLSSKQKMVAEPSLSIKYRINGFHELMFGVGCGYSNPSIETLYGNYILTNYRQLSIYESNELFHAQINRTNITYNYKNIISMWFAGVDLIWVNYHPEVLYGTNYDGVAEKIISRPTDEVSNSYSAILRSSKGFDWKKTKISVDAKYTHFESPLLLQEQILRYFGNSYSTNLSFNSSPFNWMSATYSGGLYISKSKMQFGQSTPTITTLKSNFTMDFYLPEGINLRMKAVHYYNNMNNKDKSFFLGAVDINYSIKRWYFSLALDNIFNRKVYVNSTSSDLRENTTVYYIRPRIFLFRVRYRLL